MSLDIYLQIEVDTGNEPHVATLYQDNYTHNVTPMWDKAGVYDALYESEGKQAKDIIDTLQKGLSDMLTNSGEYELLNPQNGWGDHLGACEFLNDLIVACLKYPNVIIHVWR